MTIEEDFFYIKNKITNSRGDELNIIYDELSFTHAFSRCFNGSVYIINYEKKGFDYVSDNELLLCGYSPEEVKEMGYKFYEKVVPQEDLDLLKRVNKIGFDFFDELSLQDRMKYTISYDFYLKNGLNRKILINHKLTPMLLTKSGKIWKALCVVSHSIEKESGNIKLIKNNGSKILKYDLIGNLWQSSPTVSFSEKEKEIIRLSIRGYSIQDISSLIHLSPETIKFHRRKIFQKLDVENIFEVLSKVVTYNIL